MFVRLMLVFAVIWGGVAFAQTTRHTKTTTTTTIESDDDGGYDVPADAVPAPKNLKPPGTVTYTNATLSQTFGSNATTGTAGCKTDELSKSVVKDLKRECAAWVKEQKGDLGKNYLGNTCESSCDDCGMSLVRCKVTGTIRYKKSSSEPEEDVE